MEVKDVGRERLAASKQAWIAHCDWAERTDKQAYDTFVRATAARIERGRLRKKT